MEQEKINHIDLLPDELLEPIFIFSGSLSRFVLYHVSKRFHNFVWNNKENKNNICSLAKEKKLFKIFDWACSIGYPFFVKKTLLVSCSEYYELEDVVGDFISNCSCCPCSTEDCQDMIVEFKLIFIKNKSGEDELDKTKYSLDQIDVLKKLLDYHKPKIKYVLDF